jgi:ABC-type spermidine/putrescine transport system permease subunit I
MEIESAKIASSIMVLIFTIGTYVVSIIIEDKHTIVVDDFIGLQKNEE